MDDIVKTYGIQLVRKYNDEVDAVITIDGYGLLSELLNDLEEMIEKEKFDVNSE